MTLLEQTDNQRQHMTVLIRTSNNIKQLTPIFFTCLFMFSRIRDRSQKTLCKQQNYMVHKKQSTPPNKKKEIRHQNNQ